jgi:hypothetical protein
MAAIELHFALRPQKRVQTKADRPFDLSQADAADGNGQALKRGRGRPSGSKNRPKSELPESWRSGYEPAPSQSPS